MAFLYAKIARQIIFRKGLVGREEALIPFERISHIGLKRGAIAQFYLGHVVKLASNRPHRAGQAPLSSYSEKQVFLQRIL